MHVWCKFGDSSPIQICEELSCEQGKVLRTDGWTGGRMERGQWPSAPMATEGKNEILTNHNPTLLIAGHRRSSWVHRAGGLWIPSTGVWSSSDLIHQSHSAPVPYHTMHHWEQKYAYFCPERCVVRYGIGALWDLWDWSTELQRLD